LPVDAGDGESGLARLGNERGDFVAGDRVEPRVRKRFELPQVLEADPVVFERLGLAGKRDSTNGAKSLSMNSRNVGTGFLSRMPTSAFARPALCAASICSATRSTDFCGWGEVHWTSCDRVCGFTTRRAAPLFLSAIRQMADSHAHVSASARG
jgi:hypothetical protein